MPTLIRRAGRITPAIQTFHIVFAFFRISQQFLFRDLQFTHALHVIAWTHFIVIELVLRRLIQLRFIEISEGLDLGTFRL